MKTRSDYTVNIYDNLIFIVDLNLGRMSVTNDAENVVEDIREQGNLNLDEYIIVSQDGEGELCEFITKDNEFYGFQHVGATTLNETKGYLANRLAQLKLRKVIV